MAAQRLQPHRLRRHRMDARVHRPRLLHDPRPRLLLRRPHPPQIRHHHHDAVFHFFGDRLMLMVPHRLLPRLRRDQPQHHRQPLLVPALPEPGPMYARRVPDVACNRHHPGDNLRWLSDAVRRHHPRSHRRRIRRPLQIRALPPLPRPLEPARLLPVRTLGVVTERIPVPVGRAGLRGGHCGAHCCGVVCAGLRAVHGKPPLRLGARPPHRQHPPQPHLRRARRGHPVVRLVRLQRRCGGRV
mmetsp:Transcript_85904/g.229146  ORF Transcript_85904/g.229146 Transcript_85904/m.229146 type:complete len:242 (+) Transcript_85904:104-829(+)